MSLLRSRHVRAPPTPTTASSSFLPLALPSSRQSLSFSPACRAVPSFSPFEAPPPTDRQSHLAMPSIQGVISAAPSRTLQSIPPARYDLSPEVDRKARRHTLELPITSSPPHAALVNPDNPEIGENEVNMLDWQWEEDDRKAATLSQAREQKALSSDCRLDMAKREQDNQCPSLLPGRDFKPSQWPDDYARVSPTAKTDQSDGAKSGEPQDMSEVDNRAIDVLERLSAHLMRGVTDPRQDLSFRPRHKTSRSDEPAQRKEGWHEPLHTDHYSSSVQSHQQSRGTTDLSEWETSAWSLREAKTRAGASSIRPMSAQPLIVHRAYRPAPPPPGLPLPIPERDSSFTSDIQIAEPSTTTRKEMPVELHGGVTLGRKKSLKRMPPIPRRVSSGLNGGHGSLGERKDGTAVSLPRSPTIAERLLAAETASADISHGSLSRPLQQRPLPLLPVKVRHASPPATSMPLPSVTLPLAKLGIKFRSKRPSTAPVNSLALPKTPSGELRPLGRLQLSARDEPPPRRPSRPPEVDFGPNGGFLQRARSRKEGITALSFLRMVDDPASRRKRVRNHELSALSFLALGEDTLREAMTDDLDDETIRTSMSSSTHLVSHHIIPLWELSKIGSDPKARHRREVSSELSTAGSSSDDDRGDISDAIIPPRKDGVNVGLVPTFAEDCAGIIVVSPLRPPPRPVWNPARAALSRLGTSYSPAKSDGPGTERPTPLNPPPNPRNKNDLPGPSLCSQGKSPSGAPSPLVSHFTRASRPTYPLPPSSSCSSLSARDSASSTSSTFPTPPPATFAPHYHALGKADEGDSFTQRAKIILAWEREGEGGQGDGDGGGLGWGQEKEGEERERERERLRVWLASKPVGLKEKAQGGGGTGTDPGVGVGLGLGLGSGLGTQW